MAFQIHCSVFILFILGLCVLVRSDSPCKEETPCRCVLKSGTIIDLYEIGIPDKPRFANLAPVYHENDSLALFSYNPCFPFTEKDSNAITLATEAPCTDSAGCKLTPGTSDSRPELHSIGKQNSGKWQSVGDTGIQIFYKVPGFDSNLTVNVVCNPDVAAELSIESGNAANHTMTLTTKCACENHKCKSSSVPDDSSSSLSTGSILLIIFFTLMAAYVLFGVIYNYCNGASGAELLPHIGFWTDLPKLIGDGCNFVCSCFGGRSQSSYADM